MLIFSLLVLQVLSGSFCYDIELEGNVKIGSHFVNALRQPSELVNLVLKYLTSHIQGKGKLPRAVEPMPIMVMRAITSTSTEKIENKKTDPLEQLVAHLQKKGKMTLNNIGTKIITDLNITKDITPILNIITNDYAVMVENYYDFVKKSQNKSERHLLYLDMAETSCELLHNEEKKLLNDIIMHNENQNTQSALQHGSFQNMTEKLLDLSHKDKKEAFKYICDTYNVCRQYPAFTDYFANLISEVLKLEDYKLLAVLNTLTRILQQNEKMLAKISEKEDRELIMAKLRDSSNNLFAAKELLIVARSVLTQRFKTVSRGSAEFKTRSKVTRIILDILDKALTTEDDILAIDFDNSVHVIRHWSILKRNEVDKNLEEFAKSLLRKLQHNLTKDARKEIKVIIKTIMRGNTEDNEVYQRLIKFGSKYVGGEDFHSDLEIMNI